MTQIPADVCTDIDELISCITGFEPNDENYLSCRRYCYSHLAHHRYPPANKSHIEDNIKGFQSRFFTHGFFEVASTLKEEYDRFLSHHDLFKTNPQVEIEWNLLSLVTALASNLAAVKSLPALLPIDDEIVPAPDNFDWGSYLKEGLPQWTNHDFSGSDSLSSLSTEPDSSDESCVEQISQAKFSSIVEPTPQEEDIVPELNVIVPPSLELFRIKRDKSRWLERDICAKGNFTKKWYEDVCKDLEPPAVISEKECLEIIFHSLLTGTFFPKAKLRLSFITAETLRGLFDSLETHVKFINDIHLFLNTECTWKSVTLQAYKNALKTSLTDFELSLQDIYQEDVTVLRAMNEIEEILPHIRLLSTIHSTVVSSMDNKPTWWLSQRILAVLQVGVIQEISSVNQSSCLAMFLSCFIHQLDILDALLTSSADVDVFGECVIYRTVTMLDGQPICSFNAHLLDDLKMDLNVQSMPLLETIVCMIMEARCSLSLLYTLNRFYDLSNDSPALSETLINGVDATLPPSDCEEDAWSAIYAQFASMDADESVNDHRSGSHLGFKIRSIATRLMEQTGTNATVYKAIESTVVEGVAAKLASVKELAKNILLHEYKPMRHFALLRNLFLHNDSSLLLNFRQILFYEETSWDDPEYLTLVLRECVQTDFPDLASNLCVTVNTKSAAATTVIDAIDSLIIEYKVPYPISIFITSSCLLIYNEIFRALLKLKWANATLNNLPFPAKTAKLTPAVRSVLHRLQIFRFCCLADFNLINIYFMAQVTSIMSKPLEEFEDIQLIIKEHETMLQIMHRRCLLSEDNQFYTMIFEAMIPICLQLRQSWYLSDSQLVAKLKIMEKVQKRAHKMFQRLMAELENENYVGGRLICNTILTTVSD